jgi:hypothetical protein
VIRPRRRRPDASKWWLPKRSSYGAAIFKTIDDDRVVTGAGATVRLNWPLVPARDTNRD